MGLTLQRPLCVFDLEATGTSVTKDRIVEISILKVYPNGNKESYTWLVNPEMPIPAEVVAIHGIDDEKVAQEPTFKDLAPKIVQVLQDADLAGYNSNKYDIPLLAEELERAGIDFDLSRKKAIDVQNIFHRKEKRTLEAAYRFYCDRELVNAHSAQADVEATFAVLEAQLARYDDLQGEVGFLAEYSNRFNAADFAGFIVFNEAGEECFSFGKYKNQPVETVLDKDPGYFGWLLNADFPLYTKKVLTAIKLRKMQGR